MQVYSSGDWRKASRRYRKSHPTCARCRAPSLHVDHRIPRRLLELLDVDDVDHPRWLQALCPPCHNAKTQIVDRPIMDEFQSVGATAALAQRAEDLNAAFLSSSPTEGVG